MSLITETVLSAALALPEGGLLSPKEFLHLGSRAAVDQALSRLTKAGRLLRIGRGLYTSPISGRFGTRPPSTEAVVRALEASCGEIIVATGAAEANALGLTTQVPTQEIFITSGKARTLKLGNRRVELKHGTRLQLMLGKRLAGSAIRAISWLGPQEGPVVIQTLKSKLPPSEWEAVRTARPILPNWMARAVSMESAHG